MCRLLKVSRSGYYSWRGRRKSPRAKSNERLLRQILEVYLKSKGRYGSPRIYEELKSQGISCSRPRVARIMKANGIRSKIKKRYKITTKSNHKRAISPNLLQAAPTPREINRIWLSDITYIWTREGWLYLAAILDLFNRQIVGWSLSDNLKKELVGQAIQRAIGHRKPRSPLIFHSDRGSQYASDEVRGILKNHCFEQSMSGKGNCFDNAVMESFFHTLKTELVYLEDYCTRDQARQSIFEYIEIFYNRQRRHSSLNYLSPVEFERRCSIKAA
jgi:putative transposase